MAAGAPGFGSAGGLKNTIHLIGSNAMEKVSESKGALKGIMSATSALRHKISEATDRELTGVKVQVDEQKGNFGGSGTAARLIIIIQADTAEHAYEHAKDLEAQGCVCTSSGATEVTCDCSDVH
jgi:hypothetical protein